MNKLSKVYRSYSNIMRVWNESEILIDRKSKFQGRSCAVTDQSDIPKLLNELVQSNKSVSKASHMHMYAWRTGEITKKNDKETKKHSKQNKKQNKEESVTIKNIQQGCADCGEAAAGQRLLTLLERANVVNVLVIVTRWYGGTPLGSSRFRHISSVAVESLKKGGFLP
ncbi:similar to Saccharomyces cerevisiae YDL177C Putative protein of unknown function [Maudiozyma saulgeensis]|uniref:Impact N-terminal domain-containing protein n=1 Tax=Maudiozyma saulgeensis TaxID=1789683 RepID=A0A1X7R2L3_9SACH|nr:similar to Saccharomyces cerevisiae YDL177C Putative protein of unknown function [Kazachstania saulgeensis]